MNVFEIILAAMLFLQAPGKSIYSQVAVDQSAPPPCADQYSLLCRSPIWSPYHKSYVVAETYEQGVQRYADIARAMERAVYSSDNWATPKDRLWKYVLVATFHESGFRRDVHSGVGEAARGDCDWTGPPNKRKRIPGTCRSYCLGQIMKTHIKLPNGWKYSELLGLDADATYKCLYTVTYYMDRSAQMCKTAGGGVACVMNAYGGGNIERTDWRLVARAKTYNRLGAAPVALDDKVRTLLGLQPSTPTVGGGPLASAVSAP